MTGAQASSRLSPHLVLGLPSTASREQVKDSFRKLCLQYHPDRVAAHDKTLAEARFRVIKGAYDEILRGQAGYTPPPPGTRASPGYARAWYRAQHGVDPEGPIRCGGSYGGYATEGDFYRAMARTSRNNPFFLILAGLASVPVVAFAVNLTSGDTGWIKKFRDEGIYILTDNRFQVNGRSTVRTNPYRYKHLRNTPGAPAAQAPAA